jgi:hypothetical protein
MRAEREKRAVILTSEGQRDAVSNDDERCKKALENLFANHYTEFARSLEPLDGGLEPAVHPCQADGRHVVVPPHVHHLIESRVRLDIRTSQTAGRPQVGHHRLVAAEGHRAAQLAGHRLVLAGAEMNSALQPSDAVTTTKEGGHTAPTASIDDFLAKWRAFLTKH